MYDCDGEIIKPARIHQEVLYNNTTDKWTMATSQKFKWPTNKKRCSQSYCNQQNAK